MNFNPEVMKSAISPEMMATDHALEQVKKGKNFRDAYGMAKVTENNISYQDSIRNRISLGGAANLGIKSLRKRLDN